MTQRNKAELLGSLPPEPGASLLPQIQARLAGDGRTVVVLDDDPTGTQTVHGVHVLTDWSVEMLCAELRGGAPAFYILTNSRSLSPEQTRQLHLEIGANLNAARTQTGREFAVVSRSDSTLRGHYPAECDALADALATPFDATLIIPFFLEGGRYTIDDVHYVAEGDALIPAAETPFAQDAVFGYAHSNLREWVAEKTRGRIPASEVASITLADIRLGGVEAVRQKLLSVPRGSVCIVNSASYRDQEIVVLALLAAEASGKRYLYRTAASFVRARAGITPRELLPPEAIAADGTRGGLIVVGSYVPKTTTQLRALLRVDGVRGVELNAADLLHAPARSAAIAQAVAHVSEALRQGETAALYTSRDLITAAQAGDNLDIGNRVSAALVAVVRALDAPLRYLVAKGGITSSDVATAGLDVKRALVVGQILPGVPVWELGPESRRPGMRYIVFPGNVGDADSLAQIARMLHAVEA